MESYQHNKDKHLALVNSVQELLDKGVLEEIFQQNSPGYYGRLFLRPKPDGTWRKIIDLSGLNDFILNPSFRMETVMSVQSSLRKGMWVASVDLTDAYYHVPIRKSYRKFLRVALLGRVFSFRAMPMGLNIAARIFTKIIAQLMKFLRQEGIMIHYYLDDWLIKADSPQVLSRHVQRVLQVCQFLGLQINYNKSELSPVQVIIYLGVEFNLVEGIARVPWKRIRALQDSIRSILRKGGATAREWASVLGQSASMIHQVVLGALHRRPIQKFLQLRWRQEEGNWEEWIQANHEVTIAMEWWLVDDHVRRGVELLPFNPDLSLYTDASFTGFGASLGNQQLAGVWSLQEQRLHSNNKELMAVIRAVLHFKEQLRSRQVLICSDNSATISQINHQGGTRSWALTDLTWRLWEIFDQLQCRVWARHIPGRLNVEADWLSRKGQVIPSEWSLHPQALEEIWHQWGVPHIDLFATRLNSKLPLFVSPFPQEGAWAVNAFSIEWKGALFYAFPPWVILHEVIQKIWDNQSEVILIAPTWSTRVWYPLLIKMTIQDPIPLPQWEDLLMQPQSGRMHMDLGSLSLQAWRLSGRH
jgi:ribonuclease HI